MAGGVYRAPCGRAARCAAHQQWLRAGVLKDGKRTCSEVGTVQGGNSSPLLANLYLHYVFDLWIRQWGKKRVHGDAVVVRYYDDFIVGFQHRQDAERFQTELRERFAKFGLKLHPDKTRLIEFGRFAEANWRRRGEAKPETFNFLGFMYICAKTRKGKFTVLRQTMCKRRQAKLEEVKAELWRRTHQPIPEQDIYLSSVVLGHIRYYGVPMNSRSLNVFRMAVARLWCRILRRRSQRHRLPWARMQRLIARWLPSARVCHPYP